MAGGREEEGPNANAETISGNGGTSLSAALQLAVVVNVDFKAFQCATESEGRACCPAGRWLPPYNISIKIISVCRSTQKGCHCNPPGLGGGGQQGRP